MTEYELDKIKKSFVRSNAKCPVEVACLLTVIKYYNGKETDIHTLTEWCKINGKLTLAGMKQGAIYSGMKAEICLQNIHQLTQRKLPIILFTLNDFINPEKPDVPLNKNDAFQKVQKRRVQEKR